MTMQRLCHRSIFGTLCVGTICSATLVLLSGTANSGEPPPPTHYYPTQARVEYVNECIANHDDSLANVYQCSCTIDRLADSLSYDDFVSSITFARYAGLPGEGGGLFRDSEQARATAKRFRLLETEAQRACGLKVKT
ncbi:hypothetical protein [Steroidobacter sp.]|uniref:hypothetical protein n=1 Tax=Steroidobacter sp. TaxID=1978227 RepID=UPI001A60B8CD|nr:hypothetical protein [Steroidobacter sp.]MBL8270048.1 hypothetical protein [Steroidobacter sp.]